ncbi:MAG TPA: alkaline phosphatase family protein, partial [Byssovorax sp.]
MLRFARSLSAVAVTTLFWAGISACGSSGDVAGGSDGSGGVGGERGPATSTGPSSSRASTGSPASSSATATTSTGGGATGGAGGSSSAAGGGGGDPTQGHIQHVIVIVKENHTFDNYFGSFPGVEGTTTFTAPDGSQQTAPAAADIVRDMCHSHDCALADWDGGQMTWGSDPAANQNNDYQAWAQYDGTSIPNYWAYAEHFTLADHFFANVLGPSFPGHTFVLAAQAGWATDNPGGGFIPSPYWGCDESSDNTVEVLDDGTCTTKDVAPCFDIPSVPTVLPPGVSWKFYGTNFYLLPEIWSMFDAIDPIRNTPLWNNIVDATELTTDIQNHTLP